MNFDYIPLDKAVIDDNVKELDKNRKMVLSKIRFDDGFENSIIALDFLNELVIWGDPNSNIMVWSRVNIRNVVYNVAYNYLKSTLDSLTDDDFYKVLRVVNRWSHAFKCAYDHSSTVNFSWAFNELLKEIKPLIVD